jgi:hypothetical protein
MYRMSVRVRSAGQRVGQLANGAQIGSAAVAGGWRVVSAPVWVSGSTTWGVTALGPLPSKPNQQVFVDWVWIEPFTAGYTTVGNKIIDPSGQPDIFRGVNRPGLELQANPGWMSDNDFYAMYLWGSRFVRLMVGQQFWMKYSCSYDPGYVARVDQAIDSITKRGMVALIDLHMNYSGQTCGAMTPPPMADDYSIGFWTDVAGRYKANPLVAFDLFNEPYLISDQTWHDGGMVGTIHVPGMQQLYDTVRATGATNLVFVSGQGFAYHVDVALTYPVDGYGIVYAAHVYNDPGTGPLPADIDSIIPPVAAKYPVMITEFGSPNNAPTYNSNVIAYAESHGLGWAAFAWNDDVNPMSYSLLESFWSYAPSQRGAPVRAALWKARGWTTWGK